MRGRKGSNQTVRLSVVIRFHHLSGISGALGTSSPANLYVPAVGLSSAEIQFRRVVFPDPEGPRRRTLSPSSI